IVPGHHCICGGIRFLFPARPSQSCMIYRMRGIPLLDDVSEFMSQQMQPPRSIGRKLLPSENNVGSDCVCKRVDGARRFFRATVSVDGDLAEVMTETRFHEPARCRVERAAGRLDYVLNDLRYFTRRICADRRALQESLLLAAVHALAAARLIAARALA